MTPRELPPVPEAYRAHLERRLIESHVDPSLHEGLVEYLVTRRPTGGFLRSVLENDLRAACARADLVNRHGLYPLVYFLVNYAPATSWGSPDLVAAWLTATKDPPMPFE